MTVYIVISSAMLFALFIDQCGHSSFSNIRTKFGVYSWTKVYK